MTDTASAIAPKPNTSAGGRLVALDGRPLPLLGTRLTATASGGLCRVLLEQRFKNSHAEPLHVSYLFPLPHDGAVSGFAFRLGERRIVGPTAASARTRPGRISMPRGGWRPTRRRGCSGGWRRRSIRRGCRARGGR